MWPLLVLVGALTWSAPVSGQLRHPSGLTANEVQKFVERAAMPSCGSYLAIDTTYDKNYIRMETDGIPDHPWGCTNDHVPTAPETTNRYYFPRDPPFMGQPYCLPHDGHIGIAINGVPFGPPLSRSGQNLVEGYTREETDCCGGSVDPVDGQYKYRTLPKQNGCDKPIWNATDSYRPQLIGVAIDGFPIYSAWDNLDVSTLDKCHGTYIPEGYGVHNREVGRYAYIATMKHFPYIMGCFRGEPIAMRNKDGNSQCKRRCPKISSTNNGYICDCEWGVHNKADVTCDDSNRRIIQRENIMNPHRVDSSVSDSYRKPPPRARRSADTGEEVESVLKILVGEISHTCHQETCSRKYPLTSFIKGQCKEEQYICRPEGCPIAKRNYALCDDENINQLPEKDYEVKEPTDDVTEPKMDGRPLPLPPPDDRREEPAFVDEQPFTSEDADEEEVEEELETEEVPTELRRRKREAVGTIGGDNTRPDARETETGMPGVEPPPSGKRYQKGDSQCVPARLENDDN